MNKETFCWILEGALLSFDGVQETELVSKYGLNPELARLGVQLCSYLKSKEIKLNKQVTCRGNIIRRGWL
jgi:hypothetical protein